MGRLAARSSRAKRPHSRRASRLVLESLRASSPPRSPAASWSQGRRKSKGSWQWQRFVSLCFLLWIGETFDIKAEAVAVDIGLVLGWIDRKRDDGAPVRDRCRLPVQVRIALLPV